MHPDPFYRIGASESSACHRKRPKKEQRRAGYYGVPYGCVIHAVFSSSDSCGVAVLFFLASSFLLLTTLSCVGVPLLTVPCLPCFF